MKNYTISFRYSGLGRPKQYFTSHVQAYNKNEALLRAGADFKSREGRALPDSVDDITISSRPRRDF